VKKLTGIEVGRFNPKLLQCDFFLVFLGYLHSFVHTLGCFSMFELEVTASEESEILASHSDTTLAVLPSIPVRIAVGSLICH
jgi:hypothetical protein